MDLDPRAIGLLLGAVVGLIVALSGAGGGILAVPLLVFGLRLPIADAAPVGLLAVGAASALGALLNGLVGMVRYRAAGVIGGVGMLLAPLGVALAQVVPNAPLTLVFALVLAAIAWRMFSRAGRDIVRPGRRSTPPPCVLDPKVGRLIWTLPCARVLAGTGAVAGLLSGLLGVGGGFVIVPALNRYTDLPPRAVLGTSQAIVALVSVGGVAAAVAHETLRWAVAAPFALGAVAALLVGRVFAARLAGARLQQAFALTSAVVAVMLIVRSVGQMAG